MATAESKGQRALKNYAYKTGKHANSTSMCKWSKICSQSNIGLIYVCICYLIVRLSSGLEAHITYRIKSRGLKKRKRKKDRCKKIE